MQPVTALDLSRPSGRKDEGRRNQCAGISTPNFVLCSFRKHCEHPVMTREVCEIPGNGRVGLTQQFCAVQQRHVIQFRPANPSRLQNPEQTRFMQVLFCFRWKVSQFFRPRRTLAQLRDECPGAGNHCCGIAISRGYLRGSGPFWRLLLADDHSDASLSDTYAAEWS